MSLQAYTSYNYSPGFKSGEFHHAVLSISGTTHTLYLDGSAVTVNPGQPDIFVTYNTITNTVIGAKANVLTQAFKGFIGDVRVYNYAISATQVSSLYLNRNLVIHYPFDSYVNKMTPNYATMLYDAYMVGSLSMTPGLVGTNALTLTNSSTSTATQYIKSAPSNWYLNSTTGLTISCWVNTAGASTGNIMRIFDIPLSNGIQGLAVDISGTNQIYSTLIITTFYEDFTNPSAITYYNSNPASNPLLNKNSIYYINTTGLFFTSKNGNTWYSSDPNLYITICSNTDIIGQENSYWLLNRQMKYLNTNSRICHIYNPNPTGNSTIQNIYTNINIIIAGTYSVSFAMAFRDSGGVPTSFINQKVSFGNYSIIFNKNTGVYQTVGNVSLSAYSINSSGTISATSTLMQNNPAINNLIGSLVYITLIFTDVPIGTNVLKFGTNTTLYTNGGFIISEIKVKIMA